MKRHNSKLVALLISLLWISLAVSRLVEAQADKAPLAQADALVRQGRFPEALAAALEAIQQEPNNFKAYYYTSFALYKQGRLDEAAPYAQKALDRAPDTSKAEVQRLVDAIAGFRSRDQYVQAATEAEQNGLFAKAADIYARAWKAVPDESQDLGLKAAHIWVEKIPEPLPAAEILNYLIAHPQQPAYLEEAQALLRSLQGPLRNVYNNDFGRGTNLQSQNNPEGALTVFAEASQAEPQERAPHYMMAKSYMMLNRPDDAMKEVLIISRMGGDVNEMRQSNIWQKSLYPLGVDANYAATIRDAFGPALLTQAQQLDSARLARQQASEAAATQAAEQLRLAQEQLPATMARLRVLLGQGKFRAWAYSDTDGKIERSISSAQNCSISYHESDIYIVPDTLDETFSLKGLTASLNRSHDSRDDHCQLGSQLNISSSSVTGVSVRGEVSLIPFHHGKDKPYSYTTTETTLCFESGRYQEVDEAIRLLNQASRACSAR